MLTSFSASACFLADDPLATVSPGTGLRAKALSDGETDTFYILLRAAAWPLSNSLNSQTFPLPITYCRGNGT